MKIRDRLSLTRFFGGARTEAELLEITNNDDLRQPLTRFHDRDQYSMPNDGDFTLQQIGEVRRIDAAKLKAEGKKDGDSQS